MNREQHLAWAKQRALTYLDAGQLQNAVASLLSDLRKHSETATSAGAWLMIGIEEIKRGPEAVRRWIEGFS